MNTVSKLKPIGKIALVRGTQLNIPFALKLVLLVITSHLGKNSRCHISIRNLMIECDIRSRKQIEKYIFNLVELNLLIKIPPSDGFKTNRYEVNLELIYKIKKGLSPSWRGQSRLSPLRRGTHCPPFHENCPPSGGGLKEDKSLKEIKEQPFVSQTQKEKNKSQLKKIRDDNKI